MLHYLSTLQADINLFGFIIRGTSGDDVTNSHDHIRHTVNSNCFNLKFEPDKRFLPSDLRTPFRVFVGVSAMKAFKLEFTLTVLPVLAASVDMLGTEVVLAIVPLAGVWC